MEIDAAIGLAAAPAIISGVLGALSFLIDKYLVPDAKRLIALGLGVGYSITAWQGGVLDAENGLVAGLVGVSLGLGAMGWKSVVVDRVRS